ncbi:MAG: cupin domain-containing protein [Actinomycetota bacterium]
MIAHWDDLEPTHEAEGTIEFDGYDLGEAAGTLAVGVTRARVRPGKQSSPVHIEVAEEEIFFVLDGTGLSWQDGETFEVGAGDCIVHRVGEEAHTLIGGPQGLDVLAFGERSIPPITWLPRPRVVRAGVSLEVPPIDPWALEAAQGELELPAVSPRRTNIVNLDDVETESGWRNLGRAGGSVRTGLKHVVVPAGELHCPPHCHAGSSSSSRATVSSSSLPSLTRRTAARSPSSTTSAPVTSSRGPPAPGWPTLSGEGRAA